MVQWLRKSTKLFLSKHTWARLSTGLFHCVLYINQMYTVTYFEVNCEDRSPEVTQEFFTTYHEAKAYAKSFEEWDDVRVDYLQVDTQLVSYWTHMARQLTGLFHCVLYINLTWFLESVAYGFATACLSMISVGNLCHTLPEVTLIASVL